MRVPWHFRRNGAVGEKGDEPLCPVHRPRLEKRVMGGRTVTDMKTGEKQLAKETVIHSSEEEEKGPVRKQFRPVHSGTKDYKQGQKDA